MEGWWWASVHPGGVAEEGLVHKQEKGTATHSAARMEAASGLLVSPACLLGFWLLNRALPTLPGCQASTIDGKSVID